MSGSYFGRFRGALIDDLMQLARQERGFLHEQGFVDKNRRKPMMIRAGASAVTVIGGDQACESLAAQ